MGGIHETKGRCGVSLRQRMHTYQKHPLLKKPVGLKVAKCHEFLFDCLLPWLLRVREFNFITMEDIFNALGRKEVIYSLDIHSSLNSSVKECSLSWHRKKVDSPATPI